MTDKRFPGLGPRQTRATAAQQHELIHRIAEANIKIAEEMGLDLADVAVATLANYGMVMYRALGLSNMLEQYLKLHDAKFLAELSHLTMHVLLVQDPTRREEFIKELKTYHARYASTGTPGVEELVDHLSRCKHTTH